IDFLPNSVKIAGLSDDLGTTYPIVFGPYTSARQHVIAAAVGVAMADRRQVTVRFDQRVTSAELYLVHYANVGSFQVARAATGTMDTTIDGMASGQITTSSPNELLFGFGTTSKCSGGTGFTVRSSFKNNTVEDMVVPDPGLHQATATQISG